MIMHMMFFRRQKKRDGFEKRKQRALANPLSHFGPFSIGEERISEVIDLIGQLIRMAKKLFASNEPVSIQQHMSKLDAMLYFRMECRRSCTVRRKKK